MLIFSSDLNSILILRVFSVLLLNRMIIITVLYSFEVQEVGEIENEHGEQ